MTSPSSSAAPSAGSSSSAATPSATSRRCMTTLRRLVDNAAIETCSWDDAGESIIISDTAKFTEHVLPLINNRSSKSPSFKTFKGTMTRYGFSNTWIVRDVSASFTSPNFVRSRPELMANLRLKGLSAKATSTRASGSDETTTGGAQEPATSTLASGSDETTMEGVEEPATSTVESGGDETTMEGVEEGTNQADSVAAQGSQVADGQTPQPTQSLDELSARVQALGLSGDCQRLWSAMTPFLRSMEAQVANQATENLRLRIASGERGKTIVLLKERVETLEKQNVALYESFGEAWGAADVASSQAQAQGCDEEAGTGVGAATLGAGVVAAAAPPAAGGSASSSETAGAPPCKRARLAEEDAEEEEEDDEDEEDEEDEEDGDEDAEMKMTVGDSEQVDGQDEGMEGT